MGRLAGLIRVALRVAQQHVDPEVQRAVGKLEAARLVNRVAEGDASARYVPTGRVAHAERQVTLQLVELRAEQLVGPRSLAWVA